MLDKFNCLCNRNETTSQQKNSLEAKYLKQKSCDGTLYLYPSLRIMIR